MNYTEIRTALKEIPSISQRLKNNDADAKKDMNRVLSLLSTARKQGTAAEGAVSFSALVDFLSTKNAAVSTGMQNTLANMATLEIAKSFKSETDFLDDTKTKPLKEI